MFVILLIFVIIMIITVMNVPKIEPYVFNSLFKEEQHKYEPFSIDNPNEIMSKMSEIGFQIDNLEKNDQRLQKQINEIAAASSTTMKETFGSDYNNPPSTIDIFSKLSSSKECSSIYRTSTGSLCLDENAKKMLLSRGGNQT